MEMMDTEIISEVGKWDSQMSSVVSIIFILVGRENLKKIRQFIKLLFYNFLFLKNR